MPSFSYQDYIESWKKRKIVEEEKQKIRKKELKKVARRIAEFIAKKYKVKKIILFGSLVKEKFREHSDIDLAIEGLEKGKYFKVLSEIENFTNILVDIKPFEDCSDLLKEQIQREGEILYEE